MDIKAFIEDKFGRFSKSEAVFFIFAISLAVFLSIYMKDPFVVTLSTFCGISYTILAGKGKVFCYYIGLVGTFCYCYISFINGFFGNFLLYLLCYFPMQTIGIFKWKQNMQKGKNEIIKTRLNKKERLAYFSLALIASGIICYILKINNGANPYIDSITTTFSVLGQILTVKRCYEQWYVWFIVNLLSTIMWIIAYLNGAPCIGTVMMWGVYFILSIYFLITWKKDLKIA